MNNALLTITTIQPDSEKLIFTTHTEYETVNNEIVFSYEENLSDDTNPVNTRLIIGSDNILVERSGATGGDMFFKKCSTYETKYRIAGGLAFDMKIFTTVLNIDCTEKGINAEVAYDLCIAGNCLGGMGMTIKAEYLNN